MSRREDRTQRRVTVVRHTRPPSAGRFARRPGPGSGPAKGWRAKLPGALQRPLGWQSPVAGRAVVATGKAAASATRSVQDRLRRLTTWMPQTLTGRLLAAVGAVLLFTGATWATTRSALLDVDHIEVRGGAVVTPEEATARAGLRLGQPMASVDHAAAERRLRGLPWVDTAVVERSFPNTVRIELTERRAAAMAARPAGGWALLDRSGRVLAERSDPPTDLPEVIGAGAPPVPGGSLAGARAALDVLAALPEGIRAHVTGASLDGEAVTLHTGGTRRSGGDAQMSIRIGAPTSLSAKMAALSALLERIGGRSVAVLDLRVPTAPVVVPSDSSAATSTPAAGRGVRTPASPGRPRD